MIAQGLYDPANEHDACGVGFIAHIKGNKSHSIIEQGLLILKNLDHRGAVGADALMGDGAGILIQIPDQYFRDEMAKQGVELPPPGEYGVGMVFLPKENASRIACEQEIERAVRAEGQVVLGWRNVPVDDTMPMSPTVRAKEPVIRQIFIGRGPDVMVTDALERKLYVIRKSSGHAIQALKLLHGKEFFVPSMSARTIVYKGLLLADQVGVYLQGPAGPALRLGPGPGAPALLDQYLPGMAAGPPLPPDRPQRRDQHRQGQLQLDPRARRHDEVGRAGRRPAEAVPADL
jgi:glutamate synthase (NADPH/NADH) large chain